MRYTSKFKKNRPEMPLVERTQQLCKQPHKKTHNNTKNTNGKQWIPLSTSVGADNADTTVHVEAKVQAAEEPGQGGGVLEVHVAHLHDGRRQRHHLQRTRKGREIKKVRFRQERCPLW